MDLIFRMTQIFLLIKIGLSFDPITSLKLKLYAKSKENLKPPPPITPQKDTIIKTIPFLPKEYSISFDVKLMQWKQEWANVLHLTTGGDLGEPGFRVPAVFFLRDMLKICSTVGDDSNYCSHSLHFPLNVWTNITITYSRIGSEFWYTILLNGTQLERTLNQNPSVYKNVDVFCSNPWSPSFDGFIRDLDILIKNDSERAIESIVNGTKQLIFGSIHLIANNTIKTIPLLPMVHNISLSVKLTGLSYEWTNVVHLTIDGDRGKMGYRIPGLFFYWDDLYICSAISSDPNYCVFYRDFPLNKWINIRIINTKIDTVYMHSVYVGKKLMDHVLNLSPQDYYNVKIYATDPWHFRFTGEIANLTISFKDSPVSSQQSIFLPSSHPLRDGASDQGNCSLSSYTCVSDQYQPGDTNMATFQPISEEQCAAKCCNHPLCVGFDYTGEISRCFLSQYSRKEVPLTSSVQRTIQCQRKDESWQYRFISMNMTWLEAETECQRLESHLVTITSTEQNRFLTNELKKRNMVTAWIGFNDRFEEGSFEWIIPLKSSGYTNWNEGAPNGKTWENCVELIPWRISNNSDRIGTWNDAACHYKKSFICQRSTGVLACGTNTTAEVGILTSPNYPNNYLSNHSCSSIITVPTDKYLQITIQEMDLQYDATCSHDYLEIIDGELSNDPVVGKYCGKLQNINLHTGLNKNARITLKTGDNVTNGGFRLSWTAKGGSDAYRPGTDKKLYKLYTDEKSWFDAKKACENDDARLAVDDNNSTHKYISQEYGTTVMWIGASDIRQEGNWLWMNGNSLNSSKTYWERGHKEPNGGITENCLNTNQIFPGSWNDEPCSTRLPFLCQKGPDTVIHPFTTPHPQMTIGPSSSWGAYECGTNAVSDGGVLSSPINETDYRIVYECITTITVAVGKYIHIIIEKLNLKFHSQCHYGYLEIIDGVLPMDRVIGRFCGEQQNKALYTGANKATIRLTVYGRHVKFGFHLSWWAKGSAAKWVRRTNLAIYKKSSQWDQVEENRYVGNVRAARYHAELKGYPHFIFCRAPINLGRRVVIGSHAVFFAKYLKEPWLASAPSCDFYTQAPITCGTNTNLSVGILASPNYPENYPNKYSCTTIIMVPAHKYIQITVEDLDIEYESNCMLDYLEIIEGKLPTDPLISKLCGSRRDLKLQTLNNFARIKFSSDDMVNSGQGFLLSWQTKDMRCVGPNDDCCTPDTPCNIDQGDCDTDDDCSGSLKCGNNNCQWGGNYDCCTHGSLIPTTPRITGTVPNTRPVTLEKCAGSVCTEEYEPVCASDGSTYTNICHLKIAQCKDDQLRMEYDGICRLKLEKCTGSCTAEYRPVCASNGKTYSNDCHLMSAQCKDDQLQRKYDGMCRLLLSDLTRATSPNSLPIQSEDLPLVNNTDQNDNHTQRHDPESMPDQPPPYRMIFPAQTGVTYPDGLLSLPEYVEEDCDPPPPYENPIT